MNKSPSTVWLNLNAAAKRLGVHPATLRRWADEGKLPFMVTPGGHRRFSTETLEEFIRTHQRTGVLQEPEQVWAERALAETRKEIVVHRNEHWVSVFSDEERERSRELGRRLMGVMLQYVSQEDSAGELLQEAHDIGRAYAAHTLQRRLSLIEALQAMVFFRDTLFEAAVGLPRTVPQSPDSNLRLMRRMSRLLNTVQFAIVAAYEQSKTT